MRLGRAGLLACAVAVTAGALAPVQAGASPEPAATFVARVHSLPSSAPGTPTPEQTTPPIAYGDVNCTFVGVMRGGASQAQARTRCDAVVPQLQAARRYVEGLVGLEMLRGIELVLLTDPINASSRVPAQSTSVIAGSVGCYAAGTFEGDPDCAGLPPEGPLRDAAWRCQIQISGDFASAYDGNTRQSSLAHELFHCFQRDRSDQPVATFNRYMPWLTEGSAAWVGEAYAGGSPISRSWWRQSVTAPGASSGADACPTSEGPPVGCIFGRARGYSAHAFFFALAAETSDVAVVANVLRAIQAGGSNTSAMAMIASDSDPVWQQWAGFGRVWRAGGAHWDLRAPGNNASPRTQWSRSLSLLSGPQVSISAAPTENKIADITWNEIRTGEQNMVIELHGMTVAHWVDGSGDPVGPEITTSGGDERIVRCITSRCTSGAERPPNGAQKIVIAISGTGGGTSTATVAVECPAPTTSGSTPISALDEGGGGVTKCCLVGEWEMAQAPVYASFDTVGGGAGARLTIDPDGNLREDFGPMQTWDVRQAGRPELGTYHMKLDGVLTSTIDLAKLVNQRRLRASALDFSGVSVTASVDGIEGAGGRLDFGTQPFSEWFALATAIAGPIPEENPVALQCSATEMRLTDSTSGITHVFTRLSDPVCGGGACEVRRGSA